MVVSEMSEIALNENGLKEVRQHAIEALQRMSASDPDVYQKTTLELFASRLPRSLSSVKEQRSLEITSINSILNILVQISCSMPCLKENDMGRPELTSGSFWHRNFDATIFKLLWILDEALKHEGQQPYLQAIIVTIVRNFLVLSTTFNFRQKPQLKNFTSRVHSLKTLFKNVLEPCV